MSELPVRKRDRSHRKIRGNIRQINERSAINRSSVSLVTAIESRGVSRWKSRRPRVSHRGISIAHAHVRKIGRARFMKIQDAVISARARALSAALNGNFDR